MDTNDKFTACINIFTERIHVELHTYIACKVGFEEESKILSRIATLAECIRYMRGVNGTEE